MENKLLGDMLGKTGSPSPAAATYGETSGCLERQRF
jgi:hypothetical protein